MSESDVRVLTIQVAQASGMVSVQAGCSIAAALVLIESRAQVRGETAEQVAAAIIDRRITFGGEPAALGVPAGLTGE